MRPVKNFLLRLFLAFLLLAILLIVLYETGVIDGGQLALHTKVDFIVECVLVLLTICAIPLALRLFKFRRVHDQLMKNKEKSLISWGMLRIVLLGVPMLANIFAYYTFQNMGYSYLALILFLSMWFVFPTLGKCYAETEEDVKPEENSVEENKDAAQVEKTE